MNMNIKLLLAEAEEQADLTAEELSARFPACEFFLPMEEVTGASGLTERMSGAMFTRSGMTITNNGDGTVSTSSLPNSYSGTLPVIGTKFPVLMAGSKNNASVSIFVLGDPTSEQGIRIGNGVAGATLSRLHDGVTGLAGPTVTPTAGDGSTFISRMFYAKAWNTAAPNGLGAMDIGAGAINELTGTATTGITSIPAFTANTFLFGNDGAGVNKLGFAQLWCFTTLPSAALLKAALAWTHAMAQRSTPVKALFPGFAGLT